MRGVFAWLGAVLFVFGTGTAIAQDQSIEEMIADRVLGDEDAPVTMIEYSSLTCPHCAAFHRDKLPELKKRYIDTGKVKFIIRDYPLEPRAAAGSMLARCAAPERFYPLMDFLFERQAQWAQAQDPIGALGQIGRFAQMSQADVDACFQNQELYTAIVEQREVYSGEVAIRSTPTFTINGDLLVGNDTLEKFIDVIEGHL